MMFCASSKTRGLELEQHAGMVAGDFDGALALAGGLGVAAVIVGLLGVHGVGIAAAHLVAALAADGFDVDFLVLIAGVDELVGGLEDVGVEGAGKALVAADDDQQNALLFAGGEERVAQVAGLRVVDLDAARERLKHAGDHAGVGPGREQRSCARRSLAAETIFMALVICRVFFTLRMRRRRSSTFAISFPSC